MSNHPPKTSDIATEADWTFTEDSEVVKAVATAARKIAQRRTTVAEDDLYQEGLLYLSVRPQLAVSHPARVYSWVVRYLAEQERVDSKHEAAVGGDTETWEEEMGLYNNGMQDDKFAGMSYPEELVRVLLEAYWNGWTVVDEFRPDPDMPRAKPNPSRLGTDMAHRVDIGRALDSTPLSRTQRVALQLTIGEGMTQAAAAFGLGISQQATSKAIEQGLYLLCLQLNGVEE